MKKKVLPPIKSAAKQSDAMPTHPAEENRVNNVSDIHVPEEPAMTTIQANNIVVQPTAIDQNKAVGRIPYQEGVTPTGGKFVSIPILTAPATLAPQIALTYNSQAGNGVAGFGWDIAGISAITVASRSMHHDGRVAPITMENQIDGVFTLDGIRLININNPRGIQGFHYETAQGFIVVRRSEVSGTNITEFEALYPDGSKAIFRNDNAAATRYIYPLRWIEDKNGNRIDFKYYFLGNMFFIRQIGYGGRTAGAHPSEILFTYSSRTDYTRTFIAGTEVRQNRLLTGVVSRNDGQILRTYNLIYQMAGDVNRLIRFDCSTGAMPAPIARTLNPLIFEYPTVEPNRTFPGIQIPVGSVANSQDIQFVDNTPYRPLYMRGKMRRNSFTDGMISHRTFRRHDHLGNNQFGSRYPVNEPIYITPELGVSTTITIRTGAGFQLINAVDIDGDGVDEVVKVNNIGLHNGRTRLRITIYRFTTATSHQVPHNFTVDLWIAFDRLPISAEYYFGDFRGNGKTQLLVLYGDNSMFTLIDLDTGRSIWDDGPFNLIPGYQASEMRFVHALDVDGDGKTEVCYVTSAGGLEVFAFSGSRFVRLRNRDSNILRADFTNRLESVERPLFGDITGNGQVDIILPPRVSPVSSTWICYLNTGTGFIRTTQTIAGLMRDDSVMLIDMNRNGLSDLIHIRGSHALVRLNNRGTISRTGHVNTDISVVSQTALLPANVVKPCGLNSLITIQGTDVFSHSFSRNQSSEHLMTAMINSYRVRSQNVYNDMTDRDSNHYSSSGTWSRCFPFAATIFPLQLLTSEIVDDNKGTRLSHRTYTYREAVMHRQGLGFCGFARMDTRDVIAHRTFEEHRNPQMLGVVTRTDSPFETGTFNWTENRDSQRRMNPRLTSSQITNRLTQVTTHHRYLSYNQFNNPETVDIRFGGNTTNEPFRTVISQTFFTPTAARYIIGQPLTKTVTDTREGKQWTNRKVITYDTNQRPITLTAFTGEGATANNRVGITQWTYDNNGNVTSELSAPFNVTELIGNRYTYDSLGRYIATVENALGQITTFSNYDKYGNARTITDHQGRATHRVFTMWGAISSIAYPDGTSEVVSINWGGQGVYTVESATVGASAIVHYDGAERVVRESNRRFDGRWQHVDYRYDNRGRLHQVSLPFRNTSVLPTLWNTYTYDSHDRPIRFTEASGRVSSWSYNRLVTTETVNGITTTKSVDVTGRLVAVSDPGGIIRYILRPDGQPKSIIAPGNVTTCFDYDEVGRQTSIDDPSAGQQTYSDVYANTGELTRSVQDARGLTITSKFDRFGRITEVARPSTEFDTRYYYNAHGLLESEISTNGTSTLYTYDNLNRPASIQENVDDKFLEKRFSYTNGNVSEINYFSQAGWIGTEAYLYAHGHNTEIRFDNTPFWRLTGENELGQITHNIVDAIRKGYNYDRFGFLQMRAATALHRTGLTWWSQFTIYDFSLNGNLRLRLDSTQPFESFNYDHLNRLTRTPDGVIGYANNGNIIHKQNIGSMEYNNPERPYQITKFNSATDTVPMRHHQVAYTSFQRPATITENGVTANFDYNASGERVRMRVTQDNTQLLTRHYIGRQYECDEQTNTERLYLGGDAYSAPAVFIKEGNANWDIYYLIRDYLGSITHIVNPNVPDNVQELSYDAWGRLRDPRTHELFAPGSEPELLLGRGFTGHEHLPWFGLINCNARLYDPAVGRFLSPDPHVQAPLFSQSYNRYSYCINNPLKYVDRDGELWWLVVPMALGALTGGLDAHANGSCIWHGMLRGAVIGGINGALAKMMPAKELFNVGNFGVSISPQFAIGPGGIGAGASLGANWNPLSWLNVGAEVGIQQQFAGTGTGRNNQLFTFGAGFDATAPDFRFLGMNWRGIGGGLSTTIFGATDGTSQRVGGLKLTGWGGHFRYENDGFPFSGWLGDGGDRYRTAAAQIGWGDFSLRLNLFTGDKWTADYVNENNFYVGGNVDRYRLGALSFGFRLPGVEHPIRLGVNAEAIRHLFQNRIAHSRPFRPQPWFTQLDNRWHPYFRYGTNSRFSLWW